MERSDFFHGAKRLFDQCRPRGTCEAGRLERWPFPAAHKGSACKFSHDCEEGSLQITSGNKRKGKGSKENKAVEKDEIGEVRDICMVCEDCEETFIFTIKNQAYYALKGYERPERCRDCREYRGSKR